MFIPTSISSCLNKGLATWGRDCAFYRHLFVSFRYKWPCHCSGFSHSFNFTWSPDSLYTLTHSMTLWEFPSPHSSFPLVLLLSASCPLTAPMHFDYCLPGQLVGEACGATTCYLWFLIRGGPEVHCLPYSPHQVVMVLGANETVSLGLSPCLSHRILWKWPSLEKCT